ncbi:FAD-dependent oxidoreductase [Tistrella bauzanensis]
MSRLVDCDVVIVGGGVAGLAAAIDLRRRAFRVTVLEATAGAGRDLDGICGLIGTEGRAALARLLGKRTPPPWSRRRPARPVPQTLCPTGLAR